MTAQQAILSLSTFTLAGCGTGLVLIHESNPLLKGLNWMGGALFMGGACAALTLSASVVPELQPLANSCVLAAFACCYRADRYLVGLDSRQGPISLTLLGCQFLSALLQYGHLISAATAMIVMSLLVAVQLMSTARLIQQNGTGKLRSATRFTVTLMVLLILANLLRAGAGLTGLLEQSRWRDTLNLLTYCIFFSSAIALAFAFFWRTTTRLSLELEYMASTDPLTRVFNRRVFLNWCESEQARSQRLHAPFSVLMLDFDHFKKINDSYGHHVGDQVLCAAVERIQDSIRGIDVLCRWGGEEFTVLLPNASREATLIVAERVRRNIRLISSADPRFAEESLANLQLSASIGTATHEGEDDSFDMMLQRADCALYEAKRSGRNRVVQSTRTREVTEFAPGTLTLETP